MRHWYRRYRLRRAYRALDAVDADVARWYVRDGQLSPRPLGILGEYGEQLREERIAAVEQVLLWGGCDPWPHVLLEPSQAQREAWGDLWPPPSQCQPPR